MWRGNVGIGTWEPKARLDVNGDVKVGHNLNMTGLVGSLHVEHDVDDTGKPRGQHNFLHINSFGNHPGVKVNQNAPKPFDVNAGALHVTQTGNVGIGTTEPRAPLSVMQTVEGLSTGIEISGQHTPGVTAGGVINSNDANGTVRPLSLQTNGGYVGIGTTNPDEKLEVEGKVKAWEFITGDITFQKDGKALWRMFEDEDGLYLESLKTGKVYRFVLQEVEK